MFAIGLASAFLAADRSEASGSSYTPADLSAIHDVPSSSRTTFRRRMRRRLLEQDSESQAIPSGSGGHYASSSSHATFARRVRRRLLEQPPGSQASASVPGSQPPIYSFSATTSFVPDRHERTTARSTQMRHWRRRRLHQQAFGRRESSSGEAMSGVFTKFAVASMVMWMAPVAIIYGFYYQMFPGVSQMSSTAQTLASGFLAALSVNLVIGFYIFMALKETPHQEPQPDPTFLANAKASINQPTSSQVSDELDGKGKVE